MFKLEGKDYLEKFADVLVAILSLLLLIGGNLVIFSRVFKWSVTWAEEMLRTSFVLLLFLGAAFSSKKNLVAVTICNDIAIKKKHGIVYKCLLVFQDLCIFAFAVFNIYYGISIVITQFQKNLKSTSIQYPLWIFTALIVLSLVIMAIYQIVKIVHVIRTPKNELLGNKDEAEAAADAAT